MKGASKESSWFLVDEAEDLDIETLKLVGTRLAKNSVICFSADLHQTEKKYRNNNGLMEFINKFKGNPLIGVLKLQDDVRSDVSRIFNEL
jgi:PhoH-like ATPase